MPRKQTKTIMKRWTDDDADKSLMEIAAGNSIRKTAAKYGMSEGILRRRLKMKKEGKSSTRPGRPTTLDKDAEQHLVKCIGTMCSLGSSPTRSQISDLVQEYVRSHNLKTRFKDDRPGRDWLRAFLDRNNLSLKKATRERETPTFGSSKEPASANPTQCTFTSIESDCSCQTCRTLGPAPLPIPGKLWVPVWTIVAIQESNPTTPNIEKKL